MQILVSYHYGSNGDKLSHSLFKSSLQILTTYKEDFSISIHPVTGLCICDIVSHFLICVNSCPSFKGRIKALFYPPVSILTLIFICACMTKV